MRAPMWRPVRGRIWGRFWGRAGVDSHSSCSSVIDRVGSPSREVYRARRAMVRGLPHGQQLRLVGRVGRNVVGNER